MTEGNGQSGNGKAAAPTSGMSAHSTRSHPEPFVAYAIVRPSGRPM